MWKFLRRQFTYFSWGFAIAMAVSFAYALGLSDLVKYAAISAIVGVAVTVGLFFLERRFPERADAAPEE
jgi:uncharacterized membrane protein